MTKSFIFFITIHADFDEFDEKQFRGGKQTKQKKPAKLYQRARPENLLL